LYGCKCLFDHFHIIKMFNDKLSDFCRQLQREVEDSAQHQVLKGTRWLLLATAYYMKEDLRQLWSQKNQTEVKFFLNDWIKRAESSQIQMLIDFSETLENHKKGILAYYQYSISTGPLEGTNNKIKTLQRQAYGFRDREFFKLKIYALHLTKYALVR